MTSFSHIVHILVLGLSVLTVTGCMIIPVPRHDASESRCNISEQSAERFTPGATTRRDVILALGEPDGVSIDERKLIYARQQVEAFWVIAGFEGAAAAGDMGDIYDTDFFVAEFDPRGVLLKFAEAKHWPETIPALSSYGGQQVVFQKKAIQIKPEYLYGMLLLTDLEIIFIPGRQLSNAPPEFRVAYKGIADVQLEFLKTMLAVKCQQGKEYRFMMRDGFKGKDAVRKAHDLIQTKINP
ncbi:MAG: hypothetical protein K9M54_09835 [Kiritimatiellales bacterium]|nr:hypothetical protein [Kiritimatiellales bacterium]MCF7863576.1 hypothetical protein [Kiritimatiellales bacterium]